MREKSENETCLTSKDEWRQASDSCESDRQTIAVRQKEGATAMKTSECQRLIHILLKYATSLHVVLHIFCMHLKVWQRIWTREISADS